MNERPCTEDTSAALDDSVLGVFEGQDDHLAEVLRARPDDEDDWTALRRAFDPVIRPRCFRSAGGY
ncbi:hypothetical protein [Streptomyces sp. S.PB5]|uniref:hypothetical protein n=1 Tax=Streptomyces sp. S.PB5 TaxID=3020844 RepID=UPI0025B0257D|nr:hypothetical protein [Streptomyces sp. S.PB5]MDN3028530.1 hypothetical protein [Streptomyces sp. S.PB5]